MNDEQENINNNNDNNDEDSLKELEDLAGLLDIELDTGAREQEELNIEDDDEPEREEIEKNKTKLKLSEQGISKILLVSLTIGLGISSAYLGFALSTGQFRRNKPLNYVKNVEKNNQEVTTDDLLKQKELEISELKTKLAISKQEKASFSEIGDLLKEEKTSLEATSPKPTPPPTPVLKPTPPPIPQKKPTSPTTPQKKPTPPPERNVTERNVKQVPTFSPPPPPPVMEEEIHTQADWIALSQVGAYNFTNSNDSQIEDKSLDSENKKPANVLESGHQQRYQELNNTNPNREILNDEPDTNIDKNIALDKPIKLVPKEITVQPIVKLKPRNFETQSYSSRKISSEEEFNDDISLTSGCETCTFREPKKPSIDNQVLFAAFHHEKVVSDTSLNLLNEKPTESIIANNIRSEELKIINGYNNRESEMLPTESESAVPKPNRGFVLSGTRVKAKLLTPVFYSDNLLLDPENPESKIRFKFLVEIEEPIADNLGNEVIERGSQIVFEVVEVLPNGIPNFKSILLIKNNQEYPLAPNIFSIRGESGEILIAKEEKLNKSEIFNRDVLGLILNTATSVGAELTKPISKKTSTNRTDGDTSIIEITEDPRDILGAVFQGAETLSNVVAARNEARITELLAQQKLWTVNIKNEMQLFVEQPFEISNK